ncbi:type 1 glutamine amidotransferase domain-containing protein [Phenylobacterium deserti]|uniref:Type 1 glutamine amidotransferase domain-containing protein n=1 Tax=Phenylobacterium deserti TaxID=1914756 RepID=A0A328AFK9_9CAUL|nr:type 1 glutamine amidotransferase domain-containing protein [Phenylobacterium deserti]RAK52204.1 type 1 glutamine amidotransferase domain-containing protein [Phenylobacterium deserti]
MTKILIVMSAADKWTRADGSIYPSGVWAEEFIALDEAFRAEGYQVDLASPGGLAPTIDALSLQPKIIGQDKANHYNAYLAKVEDRLKHPLVLADVNPDDYDAIVVPGGHGPVEDLYKDPDMGRILVRANRSSKVIGAVCHGPAAFLAAREDDGSWPFAGRKMTSLSDEEEIEFGTAANAPWLLAKTLRERGAIVNQGPNWGAFVVRDGNLLTGQNPASTAPLAEAVIAALR